MKPDDPIPVSFANARAALEEQVRTTRTNLSARIRKGYVKTAVAALHMARLQVALRILKEIEESQASLSPQLRDAYFRVRTERPVLYLPKGEAKPVNAPKTLPEGG